MLFELLFLAAAASVSADLAPPAAAAAVDAATTEDDNKVICRSTAQLGSRVRKEKTCLTKRDWATQAKSAQDYTRRVQKVQGATNGN